MSRPISACPTRARARAARGSTVTDAQVDWLEGEIDRLNAELAPLRLVRPARRQRRPRPICILPAPSAGAPSAIMVELKDKPGESVTPAALKYVNRLSDFLFVAGRYANDKGAATCCGCRARIAEQ